MNRLQDTYLTCWQFINQIEHYDWWVHLWFQGLEHLAMAKENFSVQQPSYGMHSRLTFMNPKHWTFLRSCWKRICSLAIWVFNFFLFFVNFIYPNLALYIYCYEIIALYFLYLVYMFFISLCTVHLNRFNNEKRAL